MTMVLARALTALALCIASAMFVWTTSTAAANECFPLATLKISFQVVFPKAKLKVMSGPDVTEYLDGFNNFGQPTKLEGDDLLVTVLSDGTSLVVPLRDGKGCTRIVVGPRLHKFIPAQMSRGKT